MDQGLVIKSYSGPDTSNYAPRIKNEQWEQHKSLLRHLHDEGCKRATMLEILHKQGFHPSPGQLNAKMSAWGFKVYSTQRDSQETESVSPPQVPSPVVVCPPQAPSPIMVDTEMTEAFERDLNISPKSSRRSLSSITLCESEQRTSTPSKDRDVTLDEVIAREVWASDGSYIPTKQPSDFRLKATSNHYNMVDNFYDSIVSVAEFLCAVHCFEQAFDLYFCALEHFVKSVHPSDISLAKRLCQCAVSAANEAQCAYVLNIVRKAHAHCVKYSLLELSTCFVSLSRDLCAKPTSKNNYLSTSYENRVSEMSWLVATDAKTIPVIHRKEWLRQQLLECDETCGTLAHLSEWCEDTLRFYRLENQAINYVSHKASKNETSRNVLTGSEHDFQILVEALIIDYLNSPGPNLKNASVECKNHNCLFRSILSPSTSLIVMAHLIYEPVSAQSQSLSTPYLSDRARNLRSTRRTTPLQELRAFAAADSTDRCSAFVHAFTKHFNATRAFRQIMSQATCSWDRAIAAKRLGQLLQGNQSGVLPHAGLPSARRAVLKTMVAPYDPVLSETRRSTTSDSGSLGEFKRLASQIEQHGGTTGHRTPSDAMSIDTRSSWSFTKVTGFSSNLSSTRSSLSRRREAEEVEECRHFITDNNYGQQDVSRNARTPTQFNAYPDLPRIR